MFWQLISRFQDGFEELVLMLNGKVFCIFMPWDDRKWVSIFHTFPKHVFGSRDRAIREARLMSNNPFLEPTPEKVFDYRSEYDHEEGHE